jgi:hypothetical protein
LDTFNSVPAAPNSAVTRPSELSRGQERQGCWLTERNKGLPRNRHADDKQNTLAVVVKMAYTVFGTVWVYKSVYLNNSEKKNNATGNATTNPPISVPSNILLPILVPIF